MTRLRSATQALRPSRQRARRRKTRASSGRLLPRATEAKKTLANLFAAPGRIRVGLRTIAVDLAPAGTDLERSAFATFLDAVNREKLVLPGDDRRRRLRFRSRIQ